MADVTSAATGRRYGVARVCQVWEVPRSTFYAAQQAGAAAAGSKPSPARRGPKPAISDEDLLAAIRAHTRPETSHERHIITEAPNLMWATDASVPQQAA